MRTTGRRVIVGLGSPRPAIGSPAAGTRGASFFKAHVFAGLLGDRRRIGWRRNRWGRRRGGRGDGEFIARQRRRYVMLSNLRLLGSPVLIRNDEKYTYKQGKSGTHDHHSRFSAQFFFPGIGHI
jgi:hypothetical protein